MPVGSSACEEGEGKKGEGTTSTRKKRPASRLGQRWEGGGGTKWASTRRKATENIGLEGQTYQAGASILQLQSQCGMRVSSIIHGEHRTKAVRSPVGMGIRVRVGPRRSGKGDGESGRKPSVPQKDWKTTAKAEKSKTPCAGQQHSSDSAYRSSGSRGKRE